MLCQVLFIVKDEEIVEHSLPRGLRILFRKRLKRKEVINECGDCVAVKLVLGRGAGGVVHRDVKVEVGFEGVVLGMSKHHTHQIRIALKLKPTETSKPNPTRQWQCSHAMISTSRTRDSTMPSRQERRGGAARGGDARKRKSDSRSGPTQ